MLLALAAPRGGRGLAGRRRADLLGQRGERAQRRPGLRRLAGCAPTSASSSTTRRRSARSSWRRRPSTACTRPSAARAAHAGIRPEAGRSAIVAAAKAIAAMPHGRIDDETTANVGTIAGGVGGTNVVAEHCWFDAEARSLSDAAVETRRGRDGRPLPRRRQRPGRASATSTSPSSACSAPTASGPRRPAWSPPRRRCARATTRRGASSAAAARTPTRSRPTACTASTSPTAPSATTSRPSASARSPWRACST